ncbi:heavy-metal-associated domain-containing protein [Maledivibacter halophilus]|uniref:Copper chaperone n=1 Tax=Maledivibacter halophilus TaxID=36842 RepID=A0A1T5LYX7_9FIRM|nr:cation transporter [Maledivibacter halophilus]SKC81162.1 copper chaperone [Maledivibacter halophilus]
MEKIIKIEGMSCQHCENRVRKSLESLGNVEIIEISAEKDEAKIKVSEKIIIDQVKEAIEDAGYDVIDII